MSNARKPRDQRQRVRELEHAMTQLDLRRQKQISNQIATIDRLLADPDAAAEIANLHRALAAAEQGRDQALAALEAFRAELSSDLDANASQGL